VVVDVTTLVVPVILEVETPVGGICELVVTLVVIVVIIVETAVILVEIAVTVVEIAVAETWVPAGAIWGVVLVIEEFRTAVGAAIPVVVVTGGGKVGRFKGVKVGSTTCPQRRLSIIIMARSIESIA